MSITIPWSNHDSRISFNVLILALSLAAIIAYTLIKYKILSIEDSASFQTSAFELKELPGRGKGLIANRDIQVKSTKTDKKKKLS